MPGGDRTGPNGLGPMTGRRAGFCAGYSSPGFSNPRYGYGRGRGRGFGRGFWGRRRYWYNDYPEQNINRPTNDDEKTYLENLIKDLENEINDLKVRLQDLKKEKKE